VQPLHLVGSQQIVPVFFLQEHCWAVSNAVSRKPLKACKGCVPYAVQIRKRNHLCRLAAAATGLLTAIQTPLERGLLQISWTNWAKKLKSPPKKISTHSPPGPSRTKSSFIPPLQGCRLPHSLCQGNLSCTGWQRSFSKDN